MSKDDEQQTLERVTISLPRALAKRIADYQYEHRCKSHSDAVRRLVERGLEAEQRATRKKA
jgi:metal-responsive CopG/Arc/MetJ family transcriptional regulator